MATFFEAIKNKKIQKVGGFPFPFPTFQELMKTLEQEVKKKNV